MRLRPVNVEELDLASLRGLPAALREKLCDCWCQAASSLCEEGQLEQARLLLERAVDVDPQHACSLASLGKLHLEASLALIWH